MTVLNAHCYKFIAIEHLDIVCNTTLLERRICIHKPTSNLPGSISSDSGHPFQHFEALLMTFVMLLYSIEMVCRSVFMIPQRACTRLLAWTSYLTSIYQMITLVQVAGLSNRSFVRTVRLSFLAFSSKC